MIERIEDFKIGIIGGGQRCQTLLRAYLDDLSTDPRPVILGVADLQEHAVGMQYARSKGIFTTTDFRELFTLEDLELLLEVTTDDGLKKIIKDLKPPGVLLVDHFEARALLDKLQIKTKKTAILEEIHTGKGDRQQAAELLQGFYRFVIDINREANTYARTDAPAAGGQ